MCLQSLNFITTTGYHVYIPLWFANTALTGDSGSGKTYIFNAIRQLQQMGRFEYKVFLINDNNWYDCQHIENMTDTLIIIDNWEVISLKYPKIKELLNTDSIQSLVIGRDFEDLRLHRDYVYRLNADMNKKKITAIPIF